MALQTAKKDLRYLNKDFTQYRDKLIDFSKTYFPDIFNDFNESSPSMIFIEMASYVGDVLSYYIDNQLRESLITEAQEKSNLVQIAKGLGYKVKPTVAATVELDIFLLLPPLGSGENVRPNFNYAPVIDEGMVVNAPTQGNISFFTTQPIDFTFSSSLDPTDISIYKIDSNGNPESFLIKKSVYAKSGQEKEASFSFESPVKFDKRLLLDENVIEILRINDTDGNKYHEVDYLAQETAFVEVQNTALQDEELSQFKDQTPYLLKLRRTARRFVTNVRPDMKTEILFGAGNSGQADELIVPNPDNVGLALPYGNVSQIDNAWDPSNTMFTRAYGQAPANTDLTVKYLVGGGVSSNVRAGTLTDIETISFSLDEDGLTTQTINFVKGSVAANNPRPAKGGKSAETNEEIRQNAIAFFAAQNRAVTREDFLARIYSLPPRFGNVSKAYLIQDEQENPKTAGTIDNPLAINCYVLGYNSSKQLSDLNIVTKENLRNYLSKFRMLTDAINIKDGFIINIGIDFSIVPLPGYQGKEVLARCIFKLKEIFDIDKWQFNEPIFTGNVATELDKIEGVQTVIDLQFHCKFDRSSGYSGNFYDIPAATKNKIIYPSQDPAIFEVKYPDKDIRGRVVSY